MAYGSTRSARCPFADHRVDAGAVRHRPAAGDPDVFDSWDPATSHPSWRTLPASPALFTGKVFFIQGGIVQHFQPWTLGAQIEQGWTLDDRRARHGDAEDRRQHRRPVGVPQTR